MLEAVLYWTSSDLSIGAVLARGMRPLEAEEHNFGEKDQYYRQGGERRRRSPRRAEELSK